MKNRLAADQGNRYHSRPLSTRRFSPTEQPASQPLGRSVRIGLGVWCLVLVSGFALAGTLPPDPRGYGTHQALGLPPCSFQLLLGRSCPSCGMTTSFSHFVRAQWWAAAQANAGGLVLALGCAVQVPWLLSGVVRGRMWGNVHPVPVIVVSLLAGSLVGIAQWITRL